MKNYEKLLAFTLVLMAICWLAWMASGEATYVMVDGKPVPVSSGNSLRDILVGLVGVLGMAGQSLFRVSETASAMNDLLQSAVDKLGQSIPAPTQNDNQEVTPKDAKDAAKQVADAAIEEKDKITAAGKAGK